MPFVPYDLTLLGSFGLQDWDEWQVFPNQRHRVLDERWPQRQFSGALARPKRFAAHQVLVGFAPPGEMNCAPIHEQFARPWTRVVIRGQHKAVSPSRL